MKKIIAAVTVLCLLSLQGISQCVDNKAVKITSSKTEYLNDSDQVENSRDEKTEVVFKNKDIAVTIKGEGEHTLKGTIKSLTCDWNTPYKSGKSVYKTTLVDETGDVKNATITIEGKNDKITFVVEVEEMPGKKIRLVPDTFEEVI
jgi:hypothetical protein